MLGRIQGNFIFSKRTAIIMVIVAAVVINFQIFCYSYPQTFEPQAPDLARDFSAYYMAAWRLVHNPTAVYSIGAQQGDYQIVGQPQTFRYLPSFLVMFAPFLTLDYQNALNVFNMVQFISILVLAFFVYKLVKNKPLILSSVVAVIVLANPLLFPLFLSPSGGYGFTDFLHWRIVSLHLQTISPCYYSGYLLANAHILQNTLLMGALYFGFAKKPWLSAVLFAFGALDPRAALFSLPLLLWCNRRAVQKFVAGSAAFLVVTNLPFFFYHEVGFALFQTNLRGSVILDMTLYDWIPICSIVSLAILEIVTALYSQRIHLNLPLKRNPKGTILERRIMSKAPFALAVTPSTTASANLYTTLLLTSPSKDSIQGSTASPNASSNGDLSELLKKAIRRTELLSYAAAVLGAAILFSIIGAAFVG